MQHRPMRTRAFPALSRKGTSNQAITHFGWNWPVLAGHITCGLRSHLLALLCLRQIALNDRGEQVQSGEKLPLRRVFFDCGLSLILAPYMKHALVDLECSDIAI